MESKLNSPEKYLIFQIEKDEYGIRINHIKEVFQANKILKLPKTSKVLSGITELRGYILSVFDLSVLLWETQEKNLSKSEKHTRNHNILVVTIKGQDIGILVDQVNQITKVSSFSDVDQSKFKGRKLIENSLITQIGVLDGRSEVFIIDPDKVLGNYFTGVKIPERIESKTDDMDFDFSQYTLPDEGSETFMENMIEDKDLSD